jgi:hypothetical protein
MAKPKVLGSIPGCSGERWTAIAAGGAEPTPAEVAWLLALSDERDRCEVRMRAAWFAGFHAGERVHEDDYGRGFTAGAAALKRQIRNEVDDWRAEMLRWHVCCRECRRAPGEKRRCVRAWKGCPQCEVRTRQTFGLAHSDDYPGGAANLRATG